jgi:hypothetical protein
MRGWKDPQYLRFVRLTRLPQLSNTGLNCSTDFPSLRGAGCGFGKQKTRVGSLYLMPNLVEDMMPSGGTKGLSADPDEFGQGRLKVLSPS